MLPDRADRRRRLQDVAASAASPTVVYLSASVGVLSADTTVSMSFVQIAAQVIPVFLLLLAIEQRVFRPMPGRDWREMKLEERANFILRVSGVLGVLLISISGEASALQMIANDEVDKDGVRMIWGAIYPGLAGILVAGVASQRAR